MINPTVSISVPGRTVADGASRGLEGSRLSIAGGIDVTLPVFEIPDVRRLRTGLRERRKR
jgi:hypothetical protein